MPFAEPVSGSLDRMGKGSLDSESGTETARTLEGCGPVGQRSSSLGRGEDFRRRLAD